MKKLLFAISIFLLTTGAFAQGNDKDKDSLPNGQPFQNIQDQVDATNAAIEATTSAQAAAVDALEAADAALQARDDLLLQGLDATNAAQAAAVSALEATDAALQARDDVLQSGIEATDAAQAAAVSALQAADTTLQARDDFLQEQIDFINLTLTEQMAIIDARFTELEERIASVAAESEDGDNLILSKIDLLVFAVETLDGRADAVDLYQIYQDELINTLDMRVNGLDQSTTANQIYALQQYQLLAGNISAARSRADMAYNLASSAQGTANSARNSANNAQYTANSALSRANSAYSLASNNSNYSNLSNRLSTVENKINTLDNALSAKCAYGYYMAGVSSSGQIVCREALDRVTISKNMTRTKVCIEDTFLGCIDYDHWQYGYAYCPAGMRAFGSSYSGVPGGVRTATYTNSYAYVRSNNTNGYQDDVGIVTVYCSTYPLNERIGY